MIANVASAMSYLSREFGLPEDVTYSLYRGLCAHHHLSVYEVSNVYFCKRELDKKLCIRLQTGGVTKRYYDTEIDFELLYEIRDDYCSCDAPEPGLFTSWPSRTTPPDPTFRFTFTQHDFEAEDALSYFGFSTREAST